MNKLKLAITLSVVSFSSALVAQEHKGPFETLDSDGSGTVSFAEFQENGINMLARIDTDGNGVLTIDEFLNSRPDRGSRGKKGKGNRSETPDQATIELREEQATAHFQEMDLDGDEVISVAEFQEANFLRMDQDSNGVLTAEELRPNKGRRGKGRKGDRTPAV